MAEFITFAIALVITCCVLIGAFLVISFTIRREDNRGSLTIPAPTRACRNARHVTGFHRLRWEPSRSGTAQT
jgi:Flp pilus assembly protein protease CpaA